MCCLWVCLRHWKFPFRPRVIVPRGGEHREKGWGTAQSGQWGLWRFEKREHETEAERKSEAGDRQRDRGRDRQGLRQM